MKLSMGGYFYEIEAAELFADPQFRAWLNRRVGQGLATWHIAGEPTGWSDVFVLFDHEEGDEAPDNPEGMPARCWKKLCRLCQKEDIDYGILRLLNE